MLKPYVRDRGGHLTGPVQYLKCTPASNFVAIQKVPCAATVQMRNLDLTETQVDDILAAMDTSGIENGTIDLRGNAAPTAAGEASITSLEEKGWNVYVEEADAALLRAVSSLSVKRSVKTKKITKAAAKTKAAVKAKATEKNDKNEKNNKNGKAKKSEDEEETAVD